LTFEPLHITWLAVQTNQNCLLHQYQKIPKADKQWSWHYIIGLNPSSAICKGWSIDQRTKLPAYLFSVPSMSNIVPDKKNDCAKI